MPDPADLTEQQLADELTAPLRELQRRAPKARLMDRYYDGDCPIPGAITQARLTRSYRALVPMSSAPWGGLAVDSVQDRLEVAGIRTGEKSIDQRIWNEVWQPNQMDAESLLGHNAALTSARSFALIWRPPGSDFPEITLDNAEQMIVRYRDGSRRHRVSAVRYWEDEKRAYCTLYRADGIWKFQEVNSDHRNRPGVVDAAGKLWAARESDEKWPLPNPFGVVPVVEIPVNRKLKPGAFGYARGEFQNATGLIDRIQLLTYLGLIVAFWMGFPLRGVIGDKIARDDAGNKLPPFDADPGKIVQLENPQAQFAEFKAADRKNLSIYAELDQFATITKTPRHYLPMESGMNNLAADAIRASEGALGAKIPGHKGTLGEAWEEVCRVAGLMLDGPVQVPPTAELLWKDHESRSLSERADAATKLKDLLPPQMIAEKVLNFTAADLARMASLQADDSFGKLLDAAVNPGDDQKPAPDDGA
jgi:hypothetical protein